MDIHPSMSRLWDVAKKTKGVTNTAQLAKVLGLSFHNVSRWAKRGVSKQGALLAEEKLHCSAYWIMTGEQAPLAHHEYDELTQQMIELMGHADERGKQKMLIAAEDSLHAHLAWLDSLPKPSKNDDEQLTDFVREQSDIARRKIFQNDNLGASVQKLKCARNYFDDYT